MPGGLDRVRGVGRLIRAAETTGGVRFVTGVTTAAPASGWITVDIGVQVVPAKIPGSFRSALAAGQDVRLSVQGTLYTVDSVLSALLAPSVDTPSAVSVGMSAGQVSGQSISSTPPSSWEETNNRMIALGASTWNIADGVNDIRGDVSALAGVVDSLRGTVEQLQSALADQGHIS